MKTSEFFRKVYGFRTLFAIVKLLDLYEERLVAENSTKSELENKICVSLCASFHCSPAVLYASIYKFKHTLRYAHWDMKQVYTQSTFEPGDPVLISSHEMPKEILHSYYESMAELAHNTSFSLEFLKRYLKDQVVLDYGSGAGHHAEEFLECEVQRLILFDRPDVINIAINTVKGSKIRFEESYDSLSKSKEHIDVVWLSLVAHTKTNPKSFLRDEVLPLAKNLVIINSLRPNHGYASLFDLQVLSHTGGYWADGIELNRIMLDLGWTIEAESNTSEFTTASVYYKAR